MVKSYLSPAWEEEGRRLGMGESATGGGFGMWAWMTRREGATPLREETRGCSSWPHVSAPSPVVLPAERRTTGAGVALTDFLGAEMCVVHHVC
jgi:hypothetical protein